MKKAIQTFSTIVTAVTFLCIVIAAIFILPKAAGFTPYIVESGSMEPTIHTGAIAFINTKDRDVAVGDVVTYRIGTEEKNKLVTHRIIREDGGVFITKGDANDVEDMNSVSQEQIVGTYAYSIPKVGFVMAKLGHKQLGVIAAWIILLNLCSLMMTRYIENDDDGSEDANESNSKVETSEHEQ